MLTNNTLTCSTSTRYPHLTICMSSTYARNPSNALALFPVTSSAALHQTRSSSFLQTNITASILKILCSVLLVGWFCRLPEKEKIKKKKVSYLGINPTNLVFRYINTTQEGKLCKNSRMLFSKGMWNQAEKKQNIKFTHCHPFPSCQCMMLI